MTALSYSTLAIVGRGRVGGALARAFAEGGLEVEGPLVIDDSARASYHAAASIASNFVVTLEWMAERVAAAAGIEAEDARRLLAPLVRQTVDNWSSRGPADALTGPIARGDDLTVARQRAAVAEAAPDLLPAFDALADATRWLADARPTAGSPDASRSSGSAEAA